MAYKALDIALHIIGREHSLSREITNMRLQKLLYFTQALTLCSTGLPCFDDDMEAWDYGPVVPSVYRRYKIYGSWDITEKERPPRIKRSILSFADDMSDRCSHFFTYQLVEITHKQAPWINARLRGHNAVISKESIKDYFLEKA